MWGRIADSADEISPGPRARRHQVAWRLALTVIALTAGIDTAYADPTTLICDPTTRLGDPQITVVLDQGAGTATINYPAHSVPNGPYPAITLPAISTGPLPAKFDTASIIFDGNNLTNREGSMFEHYTLDRVTGSLSAYHSDFAPWDQAAPEHKLLVQYSCRVGKTQF